MLLRIPLKTIHVRLRLRRQIEAYLHHLVTKRRLDMSPMGLDQFFDDGQAEPSSTVVAGSRSFATIETFKQVRNDFVGNWISRVGNDHSDLIPDSLTANHEISSDRSIATRIVQEATQHLEDLFAIEEHFILKCTQLRSYRDLPFFEPHAKQVHGSLNQLRERDGGSLQARLGGIGPPQSKHVIHEIDNSERFFVKRFESFS